MICKKIELIHKLTVRHVYQNMVKSGLIPDMKMWPDFGQGRI